MSRKLSEIYWPLRAVYGLVPLLAGLDKYVGLLADWDRYVSPLAASLLPVDVHTFLGVIGIVEVVVGLSVLFGLTRLGAFAAMGWLVVISVDLVAGGFVDVAVRDLAMAVGAYTLAMVAAARGEELLPWLAPGVHQPVRA